MSSSGQPQDSRGLENNLCHAYLSVPFAVGGNGPVFHSNFEVNF